MPEFSLLNFPEGKECERRTGKRRRNLFLNVINLQPRSIREIVFIGTGFRKKTLQCLTQDGVMEQWIAFLKGCLFRWLKGAFSSDFRAKLKALEIFPWYCC